MRLPSDFPAAVHKAIADHVTPFLAPNEALDNFNGGWMGVAYRFRACADADELFSKSISANPSAGGEERFQQEQALFTFIVAGYSAAECFSYALHWMGANRRPADFKVALPGHLQQVSPKNVLKQFQATYPTHGLTTCLGNLTGATFEKWGDARNILAHRAQPRHTHFGTIGGSGDDGTELKLAGLRIDDQTTRTRRAWLAQELDSLFRATHNFVTAEFI